MKKEQLERFALIEGGTFEMGSTDGDSDEQPVHKVTLSSFYISKYQVTQAEYEAVMGTNPSSFSGCNDCPVESVSWYDALIYCNKRSIQEDLTPVYSINGSTNSDSWGMVPTSSDATWNKAICNWSANGYRLPTEAEWEYAAKGSPTPGEEAGEGYKYASTNHKNELGDYAWYRENSGGTTHPVGQKKPNALGLYDMSGNVWEWCHDWYGKYSAEAITNPLGPETGTSRVDRGGSWDSDADICRTVDRDGWYPDGRFNDLGFRVSRGGSWDFNAGSCRTAFRDLWYPYYRISFLGFRVIKKLINLK